MKLRAEIAGFVAVTTVAGVFLKTYQNYGFFGLHPLAE